MDKSLKIYVAFLVLLLSVIVIIDINAPKPINWTPTYSLSDKNPLGMYVFNEEIDSLLKIKVVKIDGYQASFGDYFVRWLFRLVDILATFGTAGFIAIVVTEKSQRLGDIAAGTAIISLKNDVTINSTILEDINDGYVPIYPLVIKLSDNDARIIKENFQRAQKHYDHDIMRKLRDKIESVTGIKNQSGNDADFIKTILKDYNYYTQNM